MTCGFERGSLAGWFVLAFFCLWLAGCGSGAVSTTSSSSSSAGSSGMTDAAIGGNVSALSISAGTVSTLSLDDLASDEEIILLLYNYNTTGMSVAFGISSASESSAFLGLLTDGLFLKHPGKNLPDGGKIAGQADLTEDFHLMLRSAEENLDETAALPDRTWSARQGVRYATVGSTRTFNVLNSFSSSSSFDSVTAELRVANDTVEFYVDTRDADAVSDEELEDLLDDFSSVIDDERRMIGTWSDVNGDGKFAALFTRVVNELGSSSGGIVTGFFYAIDLFDSAVYESSNEMEVYYTFVPDATGEHGVAVTSEFSFSNIYPGVLPHEAQHMISFNQHYYTYGGSAESGWLNEGLSHLLEDIHSLDGNDFMTASGLENPARVASYLSGISSICFSCGISLSQRGGAYLFLRYLYEQAELGNLDNMAGGTEFIQNLVQTSNRSLSNLKNVLFGSSEADDELKNLIGQFALAVYLSSSGLTDDSRYNLHALNLRAIQDDNRGTVLNGPAILDIAEFPYIDTLQGNSMVYIYLTADDVESLGGGLNLSFGTESDFGGYVIRE